MTSDHASPRRCSASQFRNEYLASDRGNRQVIYMDRYVLLFIFLTKNYFTLFYLVPRIILRKTKK